MTCHTDYIVINTLKLQAIQIRIWKRETFINKQIVQNEQHCSQGSQWLVTMTNVDSRFPHKDYGGLYRNGMQHQSKYQAESHFSRGFCNSSFEFSKLHLRSFLAGFGVGVFLRDMPHHPMKLSIVQKLIYLGMALVLTLSIENIKTSPSSYLFYAIGFMKFTTMMIGIVFVIPRLLNKDINTQKAIKH